MRLFNRVAIVGAGLIGGSLALAIKKKGLAKEIIGVTRHAETLSLAKKIKAIDRGSRDIRIVKDADLVVLAAPVEAIIRLGEEISRFLSPDCVVTDVGSTKQEIVDKLEKVFPCFIGSHPLAGSEKRTIVHARAGLFKNSLCILTPTKNTDKEALKKIKALWVAIGAKVIFLTPKTHDKVLSLVSHLPHIAAFSLIATLPRQYLKFASAGLKDTTRIAASDKEIWSDIFLSNPKHILESIDLFIANLSRIKSAINKKDKKSLTKILQEAKLKREALG